MQTGSACTGSGSAPSYSHVAGDHFIFKGGVTWPAACFRMLISSGGTSAGVQDYYGVDQTWFNGGSWRRPLFDMNYVATTGNHIFITGSGVGFVTIDNIEVYRQLVDTTAAYHAAGSAVQAEAAYSVGLITVQNSYFHDWATNKNFTDAAYGDWGSGCLIGGILMFKTTCSDANGYVFSGGVKINNVPFAGACENCIEVSNSTFTRVIAACFAVGRCHDSEFYNIDASASDPLCNATGHGCHSQVIEADNNTPDAVYNNFIHGVHNIGVNIYDCDNSQIYNNVMWDNDKNIMVGTGCVGSSSSSVLSVYNNTIDCSNGTACFNTDSKGTLPGTVSLRNNLWITNGSPLNIVSAITTLVNDHNYTMSTSEANSYGFTGANKYAARSSNPHVVSQAANLLSVATGTLAALALDAAGAAWFGGTYTTRPTATPWDLGAYQFGAQSSTGPAPPSNLAATVH